MHLKICLTDGWNWQVHEALLPSPKILVSLSQLQCESCTWNASENMDAWQLGEIDKYTRSPSSLSYNFIVMHMICKWKFRCMNDGWNWQVHKVPSPLSWNVSRTGAVLLLMQVKLRRKNAGVVWWGQNWQVHVRCPHVIRRTRIQNTKLKMQVMYDEIGKCIMKDVQNH